MLFTGECYGVRIVCKRYGIFYLCGIVVAEVILYIHFLKRWMLLIPGSDIVDIFIFIFYDFCSLSKK